MLKLKQFYFILAITPFIGKSQETITGQVFNSATSTPIEDVNILSSSGTGANTNSKGYFQIQARVGDILEVSHLSFENKFIKIPQQVFRVELDLNYTLVLEINLNQFPNSAEFPRTSPSPVNLPDTMVIVEDPQAYPGGIRKLKNDIGNSFGFLRWKIKKGDKYQLLVEVNSKGDNILLKTPEENRKTLEKINKALARLDTWKPAMQRGKPVSTYYFIHLINN